MKITLYELIMTTPTLSKNVKEKLINLIDNNQINKENIEKIINKLMKQRKMMEDVTINYINNLDKLYANHIKHDIKKIELKEKAMEIKCKEIKSQINEGNPDELLVKI